MILPYTKVSKCSNFSNFITRRAAWSSETSKKKNSKYYVIPAGIENICLREKDKASEILAFPLYVVN